MNSLELGETQCYINENCYLASRVQILLETTCIMALKPQRSQGKGQVTLLYIFLFFLSDVVLKKRRKLECLQSKNSCRLFTAIHTYFTSI